MNKIKSKTKFLLIIVLISIVFLGLNGTSASDINHTESPDDINNSYDCNCHIVKDKPDGVPLSSSYENPANDKGNPPREYELIFSGDFNPETSYKFLIFDDINHKPHNHTDLPPVILEKKLDTNEEYNTSIDSIAENTIMTAYPLDDYTDYNNLTNYESDTKPTYFYLNNISSINHDKNYNNDSNKKEIPVYVVFTIHNLNYYSEINKTRYSSYKTNVKIKSSNFYANYKAGKYFSVRLTDIKDKPLSDQLILFTINNRTYTTYTNENGMANVQINLKPGNYTISTDFLGNDKYNPGTVKNNIEVSNTTEPPKEQTISSESKLSGNNIYMVYKEGRKYQVKLTDKDGNPLKNQNLSIKIDKYSWVYHVKAQTWNYKYMKTTYYTVKTNDKGYAYLTVNLNSGYYIFTVNYCEDDNNSVSCKNTVTVISYTKGNALYNGEFIGQYLTGGKYCQVNNAKIKQLAQELTKNKKTITEKANAIYSYVRNNIKYELYSNSRYGAYGCLKRGSGNCVDQSHLIVALCRSVGIPARYCQGNKHVWTQILNKDKKIWIIADPTTQRAWGFGVWNIYADYYPFCNC